MVQRFSSQIIALITLPQSALGAWIVVSAPLLECDDDEERFDVICSISNKTGSGGSHGSLFDGVTPATPGGSLCYQKYEDGVKINLVSIRHY